MGPAGIDPLLLAMLRTFRNSLNACAEASGNEAVTASLVTNFLSASAPDALLTGIGGHGVAAVFEGSREGPTVLIRSELDGLLVEEGQAEPNNTWASASHRCGHDGHMAMVAGLAPLLAHERPARGRVVLLFQPAEETGQGALRVLEDAQFPSIHPDYAIAMHNLPGYQRHAIICRRGTFASASVGMQLQLRGVESHAAEPEKARTPTRTMSALLADLPSLTDLKASPYRLLTVTHARMGRESFGVTPGQATLCATLRSATTSALEELCNEVETTVRKAADGHGLSTDFMWVERFPETQNDQNLFELLVRLCKSRGVEFIEAESPFRWSEDFGYFSRVCPTLYFGLGIGEDTAGLHQPGYTFPDDVIQTGVLVASTAMRELTT